MRKRLAALLGALCVLAGIITAAPAHATAPVTCRTGAHYPSDNTIKFMICFDHLEDGDGDGDWSVSRTRVQNAHPTAGGIGGDILTDVCKYNSTTTCAGGDATDGQTLILGVWSSIPNSNTYWVTVKGYRAGHGHWCHRVFLNIGGGTSITTCP